MEVYYDMENIARDQNAILTVGSFDGVHLGHRYVLQELQARAKARSSSSTLVTFKPHPKFVLPRSRDNAFKVLTTMEERAEILAELGLDRLAVVPFTPEFANTPAEAFIENILFEKIGFSEIIVGFDHAFGRNREGNIETFRRLGKKLSFEVRELRELRKDERQLSSTSIRALLREGRVAEARSALGRNYALSGMVVRGDGRGKSLNFPTANLAPLSEKKLVPGRGVYAVLVFLGESRYAGMMNIGVRPTFRCSGQTIEVHIFNFDRNIYDEKVKVEFVSKIRDEQKFSGAAELVSQLNRDKAKSIEILRN